MLCYLPGQTMDIGNVWVIIADITTLGHEDVICAQNKANISIAIILFHL